MPTYTCRLYRTCKTFARERLEEWDVEAGDMGEAFERAENGLPEPLRWMFTPESLLPPSPYLLDSREVKQRVWKVGDTILMLDVRLMDSFAESVAVKKDDAQP
jgi:hypothetical protein